MNRLDGVREYVRGSLWVMPTVAVLAALVAGSALSFVDVAKTSPLAFQGTADDARNLLIGIAGTMVTVIALLLGLTVVALQLSSTQFSPRLLRNFLRDRPNQIVLSVFVATFAYTAAGLYTVGVSGGARSTSFPRLAVSGAIVLLFVSLGLLVYFADHLVHSIQVDTIMDVVQRNTVVVVRDAVFGAGAEQLRAPDWAVPVPAHASGYIQVARPARLLALASEQQLSLRLDHRVGEHVVAGTVLAWAWRRSADAPRPDPADVSHELHHCVRIGFERTLEQDAAFGIRQLVDVACKALSPAVNDPYTAVQAVEHLSVIFCALAQRPLGGYALSDPSGVAVSIPGRVFGDYLSTMCGLIRRYGSHEPTVSHALLRLLGDCAAMVPDDPVRLAAIAEQARLVVADAERDVPQHADLVLVHAESELVRHTIAQHDVGAAAGLSGQDGHHADGE